jgi:hypothetical protein
MRRSLMVLVTATAVIASSALPTASARADGGTTAAWIIGGVAVATLLLAATYPQPVYGPYGPYAYMPAPRAPVCYWTSGWDGWGWRQMRVCY